jgi:hypothetical protein
VATLSACEAQKSNTGLVVMPSKEKLATKLSALFIKIDRHHVGILLHRMRMAKPVSPVVIKRDRRTG